MSRIARQFRSALFCPPIRASFYVAGLALAGAAAAHAAAKPPHADSADAGNSAALLDFASCAKPQYPHADVQAGHQGTVTLGFLVDGNGRVKDSKIATSSGFATLDEAARAALAKCGFQPALENGKPVQQWTKVQHVWSLR